jgi:hypothetical protein
MNFFKASHFILFLGFLFILVTFIHLYAQALLHLLYIKLLILNCLWSDLSCALTASSSSIMGQDRKGEGHEVPCGKAVWLLGQFAHYVFFWCAITQRWAVIPLLMIPCQWALCSAAFFSASSSESTLRRRRARPQASLTATHSSTLAEEVVALLRTLHSLTQWNGLINKYINSQLHSVTHSCVGKPSERVGSVSLNECRFFCETLSFKLSF